MISIPSISTESNNFSSCKSVEGQDLQQLRQISLQALIEALSQCYIYNRSPQPKSHCFLIDVVPNLSENCFKQSFRVTREGYAHIIFLILNDEVFGGEGSNQTSVGIQLGVALQRFGSPFEVVQVALFFVVSEAIVVNYT